MENGNLPRTLGDYSRPSHEGYRNTIELPVGNNVVPIRFDTILLVQNGCSFNGLQSEDPNQQLKDFLKIVDSLDLNVENKERTGPHDTQYCMENPEQAFVDYASSRTDERGNARLSKFEADFKQQQSKMTNKIDTFLKAINDQMTGALRSDTFWLIAEYDVSTSIGYGVSNPLSNTAYSFKLINMAYPLPLDTAYRTSDRTEIPWFSQFDFVPFFFYLQTNPTACLSLVFRRHFKNLSLDELRSPDFNLHSDQEYSKEEEAEAMAETMDGSDNEDANEHIEKVLKIVGLFHVPNIIKDQLMLQVFPIFLTGGASRWLRNEPTGSIKTWEALKTKFLNKYCPPGRNAKKMEEINNFQQESDETLYQAWERFKELLMKYPQHYLTEMHEVEDAKKAIQEMAEYSQKWHNGTSRGRSTKTSDGLAAIQAQLNNLGREIKKVNEKVYAAQVGCEQCKGPHYTKDFCNTPQNGSQRNKDPGHVTSRSTAQDIYKNDTKVV
ncbi:hypothetical protein Tco_1079306 [Tanacetum coccineum]|uniref:Retrotransposon gag domain-containing protein n=1 Tax=Tanacetum coccineum TaxID=301880 RepID=A0ABQ5HSJ9_9ASTR